MEVSFLNPLFIEAVRMGILKIVMEKYLVEKYKCPFSEISRETFIKELHDVHLEAALMMTDKSSMPPLKDFVKDCMEATKDLKSDFKNLNYQ